MKTIVVVYSNGKLSNKEIGRLKKYSFNTDSEVSVGDLIETNEYDTNLLVVKVMEKSFKYYNRSTGEMSDEYVSTSQWEIRTLIIREADEENVVYGVKLKEE